VDATLQAHRIETTPTENGTPTLEGLPFGSGVAVEVIVLPQPAVPVSEADPQNLYPLRGLAAAYDHLTEPVALEDWDALQ